MRANDGTEGESERDGYCPIFIESSVCMVELGRNTERRGSTREERDAAGVWLDRALHEEPPVEHQEPQAVAAPAVERRLVHGVCSIVCGLSRESRTAG